MSQNKTDPATFYPKDYFEGRQRFREKTQKLGAQLYQQKIQNDENIDLTIDVAIFNQSTQQKPLPALVHFSGTHGVEGYVGSGVQNAYLEKLIKKETKIPENCMLVMVHAVNPYGFNFNRRWNEKGVDLNRNLIPEDTYPGELQSIVKKKTLGEYNKFDNVFNPDHAWSWYDNITFYIKAAYYIATVGFTNIKEAAVSGQYYDQNKLFFGGKELQQSHKFLSVFLREKLQFASKVILIDVHSGLGPQGKDTLMGTQAGHKANSKIFCKKNQDDKIGQDMFLDSAFQDSGKCLFEGDDAEFVKLEKNTTEAGSGYGNIKGSNHNYLDVWRVRKGLVLCQEFGTQGPVSVLKGLIKEQSVWVRRKEVSQDKLKGAAQTNKDGFFVENQFFKENVLRRGLVVIEQAFGGLLDQNLDKLFPIYTQKL